MCHGVPSGLVLEKYLSDIEAKTYDKVVSIEFRCKKQIGNIWNSKYAAVKFKSGKVKYVNYDSCRFLKGFACGLFFRPSCGTCPFVCKERISDITIGDAWGIEKTTDLNPHQGVSLILVNSNKAKKIIERLSKFMEVHDANYEELVNGNSRLRSLDKGHINRDDFFDKMNSKSFDKIVCKFIPKINIIKRIASKVKHSILRGVKK